MPRRTPMDVLSPTFGDSGMRPAGQRRVVTVALDAREPGADAEIARLRAEVEWLRAERDALAWAVGHDDLTGLANRRLFQELGPEIVAREPGAALMVVDLDG